MDARRRLLDQLLVLDERDPEHLPVVGLDDYFEGNIDEECIAPNAWGFGRPPLAELHARFREIAARPAVQGVYVGLHESWGEALDDDALWPAAENVHLLTSAPEAEIRSWIEGLAADGLGEGWPYGEHAAAPIPAPGMRIWTVFWD